MKKALVFFLLLCVYSVFAESNIRMVEMVRYNRVTEELPSQMWFDFKDKNQSQMIYLVNGHNIIEIDFSSLKGILIFDDRNEVPFVYKEGIIDPYYSKVSEDGRFATFCVNAEEANGTFVKAIQGSVDIVCYTELVTNRLQVAINKKWGVKVGDVDVCVFPAKESDQPGFFCVKLSGSVKCKRIAVYADEVKLEPILTTIKKESNGKVESFYFVNPKVAVVKVDIVTVKSIIRKNLKF